MQNSNYTITINAGIIYLYVTFKEYYLNISSVTLNM